MANDTLTHDKRYLFLWVKRPFFRDCSSLSKEVIAKRPCTKRWSNHPKRVGVDMCSIFCYFATKRAQLSLNVSKIVRIEGPFSTGCFFSEHGENFHFNSPSSGAHTYADTADRLFRKLQRSSFGVGLHLRNRAYRR